jgi:DNA polymerase-3 subunit epsilon
MLHLDKPLVILDLETTGIDIATDRIIEISMLKVFPDMKTESLTLRINPGIPIPPESTAIHGIRDEDVKDAPSFKKVAPQIRDFIDNADLGGYNSAKFDVPMLIEAFLKSDIGFDTDRKHIDVMRIFTLMEKRDLTAAYKFYCDKELVNAHSAEADVMATYEVLLGQLRKYPGLEGNVNYLHNFTKDDDFVDTGRRMVYVNGKEHFNFGKYKGRSVEEIYMKEPQYFDWIINNNFPLDTKLKLKMIRLRLQSKQKKS